MDKNTLPNIPRYDEYGKYDELFITISDQI